MTLSCGLYRYRLGGDATLSADADGLRAYRITWRGESFVRRARSRSAARYASWKAFRDAGYRADLPTFAGMVRIDAVRFDPPTPIPGD